MRAQENDWQNSTSWKSAFVNRFASSHQCHFSRVVLTRNLIAVFILKIKFNFFFQLAFEFRLAQPFSFRLCCCIEITDNLSMPNALIRRGIFPKEASTTTTLPTFPSLRAKETALASGLPCWRRKWCWPHCFDIFGLNLRRAVLHLMRTFHALK